MSQIAEQSFLSSFSDRGSQESSSGSSAMGSFVDASKEFADEEFVDLADEFPPRTKENSMTLYTASESKNDIGVAENNENRSCHILYSDEIGQHSDNEGDTFSVKNNYPMIATMPIPPEGKTEQDSIEFKNVDQTVNHMNRGGQFLSEAAQSKSNLQDHSTKNLIVKEDVTKINDGSEEQIIENKSYVILEYNHQKEEITEVMSNEEPDRSNQNNETPTGSTQPPSSFQNTLREGRNQILLMRQTSKTMIQEFTEGKIDIPKMISENYEAEYASKRVPSKTFKFIPPAKGLSGNYVDLGRLIAIGVLGLICGLFASSFTELTCNFASIEKSIGYSENKSYMHFGLTKFSSMDSIFTGKKFCVPYHNNYYDMNSPSFARHTGELAILSGLCAMLILWYYIFTKRTTETYWKIGIYASALASLFQICTYHFFLSGVCRDETCLIGAGSIVSAIASASFALVAFGMIHNSPVRCLITIDQHELLRNEVSADIV
jgi:hypothetical protein